MVLQPGHGSAGIHNILDQEDVLAGQIEARFLEEANRAARLGRIAVTGDPDKINFQVKIDGPAEVGRKNKGPIQHPEKHQLTAPVLLGDLSAQFFDLCLQLQAADDFCA